MAFKKIAPRQHKIMLWKNGQGSTAQIDIVPEGASFPGGEFLWRLSSATVGASGPFSQFPGCDRFLVVLRGQGLLLNGKTFGPFTPFKFAGEDSIECELLFDDVIDLGLIYRRDKVQAEMLMLQVTANQPQNVVLSGQQAYFYCISGSAQVGEQSLSEGECLRSQGVSQMSVTSSSLAQGAHLVLIKVREI